MCRYLVRPEGRDDRGREPGEGYAVEPARSLLPRAPFGPIAVTWHSAEADEVSSYIYSALLAAAKAGEQVGRGGLPTPSSATERRAGANLAGAVAPFQPLLILFAPKIGLASCAPDEAAVCCGVLRTRCVCVCVCACAKSQGWLRVAICLPPRQAWKAGEAADGGGLSFALSSAQGGRERYLASLFQRIRYLASLFQRLRAAAAAGATFRGGVLRVRRSASAAEDVTPDLRRAPMQLEFILLPSLKSGARLRSCCQAECFLPPLCRLSAEASQTVAGLLYRYNYPPSTPPPRSRAALSSTDCLAFPPPPLQVSRRAVAGTCPRSFHAGQDQAVTRRPPSPFASPPPSLSGPRCLVPCLCPAADGRPAPLPSRSPTALQPPPPRRGVSAAAPPGRRPSHPWTGCLAFAGAGRTAAARRRSRPSPSTTSRPGRGRPRRPPRPWRRRRHGRCARPSAPSTISARRGSARASRRPPRCRSRPRPPSTTSTTTTTAPTPARRSRRAETRPTTTRTAPATAGPGSRRS